MKTKRKELFTFDALPSEGAKTTAFYEMKREYMNHGLTDEMLKQVKRKVANPKAAIWTTIEDAIGIRLTFKDFYWDRIFATPGVRIVNPKKLTNPKDEALVCRIIKDRISGIYHELRKDESIVSYIEMRRPEFDEHGELIRR